jgi:hypothetical protein
MRRAGTGGFNALIVAQRCNIREARTSPLIHAPGEFLPWSAG